MTVQAALNAALRDHLGPIAREHGYQGSAPSWCKSSTAGDAAAVQVHTDRYSSSARLRCEVTISFSPEPWLRWEAERLGPAMPKSIAGSMGLYFQQFGPKGVSTDGLQGWDVFDEESARVAVSDMVVQLDRAGWPVLDRLFARDEMLARLRTGDLGMRPSTDVFIVRAEALLIMDAGPSEALDLLLDLSLRNAPTIPGARDHAERFETWVRAQAARA